MGRTEPWGIGGTLLGVAFWRGAGACLHSYGGRGCLGGLWLVRLRVRPVRRGWGVRLQRGLGFWLAVTRFGVFLVLGGGLSSKGPRSSRTPQPRQADRP